VSQTQPNHDIEILPGGDVVLPTPRSGNPLWAEPIAISLVRELTLEDCEAQLAAGPIATSRKPLTRISHSHHNLAQLIALGKEYEYISLVTGYSTTYIGVIQSDPLFAELLQYYRSVREMVFVDVVERMKVAALTTLDQLQESLEDEPERWSKREKMEFLKLCLEQGKLAASHQNNNGGSGSLVSVTFVQAGGDGAKVIEGEKA
jgi:hypothetical protein